LWRLRKTDHTGELKHACEECGVKSASSTQLTRHLKTDKDGRFTCNNNIGL
jgi:hypothetical protein